MNKRTVGGEYEKLACEYLESIGFFVIETNFRRKIGEIDIIAKDREYIVFAEVKYRAYKNQGGAAFAINKAKQQKIRRVAEWYIKEKHLSQRGYYRFDAVLIDGDEITHIPNAW